MTSKETHNMTNRNIDNHKNRDTDNQTKRRAERKTIRHKNKQSFKYNKTILLNQKTAFKIKNDELISEPKLRQICCISSNFCAK